MYNQLEKLPNTRSHYMMDKETKKRKNKEWREKNKEKLKARKKFYYEMNKEKIAEKQKVYNHKNKDKKAISHQKWKANNRELYLRQHKEYNDRVKNGIVLVKSKYIPPLELLLPKKPKQTKEEKQKRKTQKIQENSQYINSQKTICSQCGERDKLLLCFHHLRDKRFELSEARDKKRETIDKEIAKCIQLCQNCHRKHHSKNRDILSKKHRYIREVKTSVGCECGEKHYAALSFHHLRDKIRAVSDMGNRKEYSLDDVRAEIAKCIVICANCHIKLHAKEKLD